MTFTYNPTLTDTLSQVRFKLGDTSEKNHEVPDETIIALLSVGAATITSVAAQIAWSIAAKYARYADLNMDDQLTRYSHVHKHWVAMAERLDEEARKESLAPTEQNVSTAIGSVIVTGLCDRRGPFDERDPWGRW